jgi:hypothetical protein
MRLPERIVHADWGTAPKKRWAAEARLDGKSYVVSAPTPAANPVEHALSNRRPALLGFDFPIGIPAAYADRAGVSSFLQLLPELGRGRWADFFTPAGRPEEISPKRPFYPQRPGGTSHQHVIDGLGFDSMNDLRRKCERAHPTRRAAEVLFWTLGPKQVGRAAIAGWRDMLIPSLNEIQLWPFHGDLDAIVGEGVVVCETYPSEFYSHLGLPRDKTQSARAGAARTLRDAVLRLGVATDPLLDDQIEDGFATDDAYDAFVGLLGMLNIVLGHRRASPPLDEEASAVEGWILGQG